MRSFEILNEAYIYGNPDSADLVRISFSPKGDIVLIMPEENAKEYGRMLFKFTPEGAVLVKQIADENPTKEEYGKQVFNKEVFEATCIVRMEEILAHLVPVASADELGSQELADYYKEQFDKADKAKFAESLTSTANYSKDFVRFRMYVGFTSLGYLELDNQKRTIRNLNMDKSYHNRMGTYSKPGAKSQSRATYIIIDSGYVISDDRKLVKALRALVSKFPDLAEYSYVDGRSGHDKPTPVANLLASQKLNSQGQAIDQMLTKTTGKIFAFHGTSNTIWKKIQKSGVMVPGQGPEYGDKMAGHSEHLLYFSLNKDQVRRYAVRAAKTSTAVIIRAEINDMTKLRFDEDSMLSGLTKIPDKLWPGVVKRFLKLMGMENEYLKFMSESRHEQIYGVLGRWIKWGEKSYTLLQKDPGLLSYVNAMALKTFSQSGYSFGYKGSLPLKKLQLVETFESQPFNDEKDYNGYDAKYDAVKATQKFHD